MCFSFVFFILILFVVLALVWFVFILLLCRFVKCFELVIAVVCVYVCGMFCVALRCSVVVCFGVCWFVLFCAFGDFGDGIISEKRQHACFYRASVKIVNFLICPDFNTPLVYVNQGCIGTGEIWQKSQGLISLKKPQTGLRKPKQVYVNQKQVYVNQKQAYVTHNRLT